MRQREREGGWLAVARFEALVLLVLCPWSVRPENVVRWATHMKEKETEREKRRVAGNDKI